MGKNNFTHLPSSSLQCSQWFVPLFIDKPTLPWSFFVLNPVYVMQNKGLFTFFTFLHFFTPLMPDMSSSLGLLFHFPCIFPSIHPPIHPANHHLLSSPPWSNFISTFDGQILCSESLSVSVRPPAMTLFITVSSLPQALRVLWALPSYNDQMCLGPWSLCQQRTGGQPQPVGIPHAREGEWDRIRQGEDAVVACGDVCVCERRCWECKLK